MSVLPTRKNRHPDLKVYKEVIKIAKDLRVSYKEIAQKLNELGYKTPGGKDCDFNFVANVFRAIRLKEKEGKLKEFLEGKKA